MRQPFPAYSYGTLKHGRQVGVTTAPGGPTCFTFTLPLAQHIPG